ncbi:DUF3488 and transglutaminase-like domain-containing protein [uncultured Cellulomonas sp.]|uniref:transglutaminase family protein n=1 Tax=uncultured Cellulomonas sp. TaxID=189682 RepID=UPI002631177D|nr:DUF3488 and transglutaminase-like domain-containing protein [uncultured Cellulomonas sp.]
MNDVIRGPRAWIAGGLCALGVSSGVLALSGLIGPGRWTTAAVLAVFTLAAVLAVVRSAARTWWVPTVVGAVVAAAGILVVYGSPPGRLDVLPDGESFGRFGDLLRSGLLTADTSTPPAEPGLPLEALVVGGALLVVLAADLLAVGLGAPAWTGVALLALWIPPLVIGRPAPTAAFVGTALAYLLLLAVGASPSAPTRRAAAAVDRRRRMVTAAGTSVAVTVAALVVGPVSTALPGWSSVRLPDVGSSTSGSLQLADDLDMRQSLGARSTEVVLAYRADPVPAGPLRLFTLRDYDGDSWSREADVPEDLPPVDTGSVLWPVRDLGPVPAGDTSPTSTRLEVRLEGLREDRLPVPVMPRTVEVSGSIAYDSRRDEVVRPAVTRSGLEYSVDVQLLGLTADTLRTSGTDDPRDLADYLTVPQTSRTDDVTRAAQEVTAGLTDRYDQALALQSYFRSAQNFTYTTDVDTARTDDAVWDFLGSRRGYCVQFATAMTVMARTLGIPSRLAVGFLPGSRDDSGRYVVTGRDSHAWPELYFPDTGWVRFEPTPAVQTGAPPQWADPFAGTDFADPNLAEPEIPEAGAVPAPSTAPVPQPTAATPTAGTPGYLVPVAVAGGLLMLALGALLLRRRLTRSVEMRPEAAWAHLRRRLATSGITWNDAHTPRQAVAVVQEQIESRRQGPMDPGARTALGELAHAVENHRYALAPRTWDHAELEQRVAVVLRDVARLASAGSRRR